MPRETETIKLLKTLLGSYTPRGGEVRRLAELARLNKLLLAYLRRVGGSLRDELVREEARCRWFKRNAAEVVEALEDVGAAYALYKFRRPLDHVSVDLDVLVGVEDVSRAVKALASRGFKVVVREPYTVTLARSGFIVDLYVHPTLGGMAYMDGRRLLKYVKTREYEGLEVTTLEDYAEALVASAHAIYKEGIYTLNDYFTVKEWSSDECFKLAEELKCEHALGLALSLNEGVEGGSLGLPYKVPMPLWLLLLSRKLRVDPLTRATLPNLLKAVRSPRVGRLISSRVARQAY